MPLGKPTDTGEIIKGSRHYGGGHGNLGVPSIWKCPGCLAENSGRRPEDGCAVCGAGDPTKGKAGTATGPAHAPAVPEVGRVRFPAGGPASENPTGGGGNGVAPHPAAMRVVRLIEYLCTSPEALEATLRRSLVGQIHLGTVTITGTIIDSTDARQEDLLKLAKRQPGVWLSNQTAMQGLRPQTIWTAVAATPRPYESTRYVYRDSNLQEVAVTDPGVTHPDTGPAYSVTEAQLADALITLLGNRLAHTIALALSSIAQELEGNQEPELFVSSGECLSFANALMSHLPKEFGEMDDPRAVDTKQAVQQTARNSERPSVGRMVHYVAYGTPGGEFPAGICRAAVVTEVGPVRPFAQTPPTTIGLCVLNPTGLFFNRDIPYDEGKAPGTWHWPERI